MILRGDLARIVWTWSMKDGVSVHARGDSLAGVQFAELVEKRAGFKRRW